MLSEDSLQLLPEYNQRLEVNTVTICTMCVLEHCMESKKCFKLSNVCVYKNSASFRGFLEICCVHECVCVCVCVLCVCCVCECVYVCCVCEGVYVGVVC